VGRTRVAIVVVILATLSTLVLADRWFVAPKNGPLNVVLLAKYGPISTNPSGIPTETTTGRLIFAATSLTTLESSIKASGTWTCHWPGGNGVCWDAVVVPHRSLLIAAPLWPITQCNLPKFLGAQLSGHTITVSADYGEGGACSAVGPDPLSMALMAVPLDHLPHGLVTVVIKYTAGKAIEYLPPPDETSVELPYLS
jgi:hypothetical protein